MPHPNERTDEQIIQAVKDARGMIAVAARKLGVSRRTVYNRRDKSPEIQEAIEESREFTSDVAELKLFKAIEDGEAWAVCFYLKCQAKDRGYVEKMVNDHNHYTPEGIQVETLSDDELEKRAGQLANRVAMLGASTNGANGAHSNGDSGE